MLISRKKELTVIIPQRIFIYYLFQISKCIVLGTILLYHTIRKKTALRIKFLK